MNFVSIIEAEDEKDRFVLEKDKSTFIPMTPEKSYKITIGQPMLITGWLVNTIKMQCRLNEGEIRKYALEFPNVMRQPQLYRTDN
jgi:hypothetical protein